MLTREMKRDILAITGALTALWSLLGVVYTALFRIPAADCARGDWSIGGNCTAAWAVMLLPFLLGLGSLVFALRYLQAPAQAPEDVLRSAGGMRASLAALASLAAIPFILAVILAASDGGTPFLLEFQGVLFSQAWFMTAFGLLGLLLFAIAFGVHMSHEARLRRYLGGGDFRPHGARAWEEGAPAEVAASSDLGEPDFGRLPNEGFSWQDEA